MRGLSAFAGAGLALLAAGCSSGNTDYSQFLQLVRQSWAVTTGGIRITRDQAAAIPYASMGYRVDGENQSLLVLGTDSGGERLWTSASKVVIVTRDGRIVRTLGLAHDLGGLTARSGAAPAPTAALSAPFTTTRLEDFPELGMYGVIVTCNARAVGRQTIKILGQPIATMRVDETCSSRRPEWSFTDNYWVDLDHGWVWRSRQHVHPKGGTIETEIFRPPG